MNKETLAPITWQQEERKVKDLIPHKKNPRKWKSGGEQQLDESVDKFGLIDGLFVCNADGTLIDGHGRIEREMAKGNGERIVKVNIPSRMLTDEEVAELLVRLGVHGRSWDFDLLKTDFFEDVDFGGIGMELSDLELLQPPKVLEAKEDNFEAPDKIETDIVLGDVFEFRKGDLCHRLVCGDSTNVDDVDKLMGGEKVQLFLTDPPYGVSYGDKNKFLNAISPGNRIQEPIKNDHLKVEDCGQLWLDTFVLAETIMTNKASYYIFSAQVQDLMMMMMIDKVFSLKHCLIWVKNNHVLGRSDYNYKHEPFLYGWKKKGTHEFFGGLSTSVFEFPKPLKNDLHPTMKPISLFSQLIKNSTQQFYNIYDSFLGSGTTMVAAHQLERNCYGMELDPTYCQVIVNRMHALDPEIEIFRNGDPVVFE